MHKNLRGIQTLYARLSHWKEEHIKENPSILLLSFVVGVLCALAGWVLKMLIKLIQQWIVHIDELGSIHWLYFFYPIFGIALAMFFVRYIIRDDISHGITKVLYAISKKRSFIKLHNIYSSIVASSLTIGFGGSVGAEAPIVLTGSAIGSNVGRWFKVSRGTMMLMVGCGASAALAGVFKAPITGVVFVFEVLLLDLTMTSILPLLISSCTSATLSYLLEGNDKMFRFIEVEGFAFSRLHYVLLLGIFCGVVSLYFIYSMNYAEGLFAKFSNPYKKLLFGGIVLSLLIYLFPPLYGEGYETIASLLEGEGGKMIENSPFQLFGEKEGVIIAFTLFVSLFKTFATATTNGAGGTGGTFAPTLFVGGVGGFLFAHIVNKMGISPYLPERNYAMFGMAGLMSGVMHAPLTGIFLIAELTGGYNFFLPLMIVSSVSYFTIALFEPHSIYSMRLAKSGELLTHDKDNSVLTLLDISTLIEKDFEPISPEMSLGDVVKVVARSRRNIFPVVNRGQELVGLVFLDGIREIMFRPEIYERYIVSNFMVAPQAILHIEEDMKSVMETFDRTKAWNLPVVHGSQYVGFVSKSKVFTAYRKTLLDISEE